MSKDKENNGSIINLEPYSLESPTQHVLSSIPAKTDDRHILVKGLVNAGKRFGEIVRFMEMEEEVMHRSKSRKSKSRSLEGKRAKQAWVPVDEGSQVSLSQVKDSRADLLI
jgi:hypothetical protein